MEQVIDIQLVKEQLRLLGHNVADDLILSFVKGLSQATPGLQSSITAVPSGAAARLAAARQSSAPVSDHMLTSDVAATSGTLAAAAVAAAVKPTARMAASAVQPKWQVISDADVAPSKLKQAPDQQSPKRLLAPAAARSSPPAAAAVAKHTLDQRCRNFLARLSEKPGTQQPVPQQQQQEQRSVLLQVPQPQGRQQLSMALTNGKLSASSSKLFGSEEDDDDDDDDDAVTMPLRPSRAAAAHNTTVHERPSKQLQQQQWQQLHSGDESEYSSEDEDSNALFQRTTALHRVRAHLSARMAGYTAAVAADPASSQQPQDRHSSADPVRLAAAKAASQQAAVRLNAARSSTAERLSAAQSASSGVAATANLVNNPSSGGSSSSSSSLNAAAIAVDSAGAGGEDDSLPRFGFRPGYRPVGIHLPPPASPAAVQALAAVRALKQAAAASQAAAHDLLSSSSSSAGAATAHTAASTAGRSAAVAADTSAAVPGHSSLLHSGPGVCREKPRLAKVEPLQLAGLSSSAGGSGVLLGGSPAKAIAGGAAAGRGTGSIIGTCSMAPAGRQRQSSPRIDPLFHAPASPNRSNPPTPRSSPARSPAAVAPMPAAAAAAAARPAVSQSQLTMQAAALAAAARATAASTRSAAGGSRKGPPAAASSAYGRASEPQMLQDQPHRQRSFSGSVGTAAAAGPVGYRSTGSSSTAGVASVSQSSRRSVTSESLYSQRLAYGSQRNAVAPGVRKTDRVARFQQMQQHWQRDRFLCSGAGGAAAVKGAGQAGS